MFAVESARRVLRRGLEVVALLSLILAQGGCAHLRNAAASSLMEDVATATSRHDDVDLVFQALPTYLLLLEGLVEGSPDDAKLRLAAARTYVAYGTVVEMEDPERASRLFERGMRHGREALSRNRTVASFLAAPFEEFSHIVEEESYQDGAPHIFLGIYHAALPPALGGQPDKALFHFQRAIALSGEKSLMVFVQMANFYARRVFDRELYVSLLNRALESPLDGNPDLTLQNTIAKRMARRLLERVDEFF